MAKKYTVKVYDEELRAILEILRLGGYELDRRADDAYTAKDHVESCRLTIVKQIANKFANRLAALQVKK